MHSSESKSNNIPVFILKLWKLVSDNANEDLICWNRSGRSFLIKDQSRFAKEILPLYFKHNNIASFIRQLNMYGFRKLTNIEHGGLKLDTDEVEFFHQHFNLGQKNQLQFIKRKLATSPGTKNNGKKLLTSITKADTIEEILADVEAIKGRQDSVDTLLNELKQENAALWREVAILRQKHLKQQQIVEKLIQFLVSLVRNGVVGGLKRTAPLLINSQAAPPPRKTFKTGKDSSNVICLVPSNSSDPVIHDLTDLVDTRKKIPINCSSLQLIDSLQMPASDFNNENNKIIQAFVESPANPQEYTDSLIPASEINQSKNITDFKNTLISIPEIFEVDLNNSSINNDNGNNSENVTQGSQLVAIEGFSNDTSQQPRVSPAPSPSSSVQPLNTPKIDLNLIESINNISNSPNFVNQPSSGNNMNSMSSTTTKSQQPQATNSNLTSTELILPARQLKAALPCPPSNPPKLTSQNFNEHVEGIDAELNWLQDQLYGGNLNIDQNTLSELFSFENNQFPVDYSTIAALESGEQGEASSSSSIPKTLMVVDNSANNANTANVNNKSVKMENSNRHNRNLFDGYEINSEAKDMLSQLTDDIVGCSTFD